jgi:hypothetical protein
VTLSRYRYLEVVVAGKGQGVGHILYALDTDNSEDGRFVQTACIVDETFFRLE